MSPWPWFFALGGAAAAAAFHLVNQRAYLRARWGFAIAAVAFGIPASQFELQYVVVALSLLGVLLIQLLRFVDEKQSPIVATLTVKYLQLYPEVNAPETFSLFLELRNGSEEMGFLHEWTVEVGNEDGSESKVFRALIPTDGLKQLRFASLRPHEMTAGSFHIPFGEVVPNAEAARSAHFTVTGTPTHGRMLPATYPNAHPLVSSRNS